jgi:hypothetical protein
MMTWSDMSRDLKRLLRLYAQSFAALAPDRQCRAGEASLHASPPEHGREYEKRAVRIAGGS